MSGPLSAKTAKSSGGGCVFDPDDPLSCYEYVGDGNCADSQGLQHSETGYNNGCYGANMFTEATCAAKCNECVDGQVSGGTFRGFSFNGFSGNCSCLFDFGGTHTQAGTCTDVEYEKVGSGTGPITQTIWCGDACYKIKEE